MNAINLPLGLVHDMPAESYRADPGVSNSMLSSMSKSPAHCYALHLDPARPSVESTAAQFAGSLAHTLILEPQEFKRRYVAKPPGTDYRTKEGKAWRDAQTMPIIDMDSTITAESQRDAVLSVPALSSLLRAGNAEASVFWNDAATGLRCRARPDWLHWTGPKRAAVLDVKTISELTPRTVEKAIAAYGYHRQAAHYSAGLEAVGITVDEFVFGFVSSSYPFLAVAYVLDDDTMQQGREEVSELLDRFANCVQRDNWPAFGDGYQLIGLPAWARRSNEVEVSYV
jgi:hypothetical protein